MEVGKEGVITIESYRDFPLIFLNFKVYLSICLSVCLSVCLAPMDECIQWWW